MHIHSEQYTIGDTTTSFFFNKELSELLSWLEPQKSVIITDDRVFSVTKKTLTGYKVIIISNGENQKCQQTVDEIIGQMLEQGISNDYTLVGLGGGVVTDISGMVASIYKRGMPLVLIPTTVLSMVDAAIGGKNGINVQQFKNMVGTVYQPVWVGFDYSLLKSLQAVEWENGCAEIIKHAWIADEEMIEWLENISIPEMQASITLLDGIIRRNVAIKMKIVASDPSDKKERRWLNFGHTIGHALEMILQAPHGHAVSMGMVAAAKLSVIENLIDKDHVKRLESLLKKYGLPTEISADKNRIYDLLVQDKKKEGDIMNFVLLESPGKAVVKPFPLSIIKNIIQEII